MTMSLVTLSTGKSFSACNSLSILEAAAQSNINLSYSCKSGRCSACKCKLITGVTRVLHPETGLTEQERSEGWILSCVRAVESDVLLEADDLGGIVLPAARTFPCRISEIMPLASDVIRVLLRLPPAANFHFLPGQYIDLIGPNGIRRSYSLANASLDDSLLEVHIRAVEGGVLSQYWFGQAKPNDLLRLNGPLGTFFLREFVGLDLIFLATGTGIAPIKAILESMAQLSYEQKPKTVSVFWGGRESQDIYFNVADIPGSHTFIPVQSRPSNDWAGAKGYVQDVFLASKPELSNAVVYACGSDAMIQSAKACLVEAGLPEKCFYSDAFVSSGAN